MSQNISYADGVLTNEVDNSKVFIGDNQFLTATYTNTTGGEVTLDMGTVLGRITASQKVKPQSSTATDGSEQPIGVLADTYTVANGASTTVHYCYGGKVLEGKLKLSGSETLATVVTGNLTSPASDTITYGSIRDLLIRNTHLILIASTSMTKSDNS